MDSKQFLTGLEELKTPEEKITHGLAEMRRSISQEGTPHFRQFWEVRRLTLPLFKENLHPVVRSKFWDEYVELTVEARRLKEILEEEGAFCMEQIDLALRALEGDLSSFEERLAQVEPVSLPSIRSLEKNRDLYMQLQRELNLLNTLASRLSALRKEVVKTDMRMRFKAKFFRHLSELGDRVFPKRKELIEQVSHAFERDVERFVDAHFQGEKIVGAPYFALKEEIKALQSSAKVLTLHSAAFGRTRLHLSACWDQIRQAEKENRKAFLEKKEACFEQREALQARVEALKEKAAEMNLQQLNREIDAISKEIRVLPFEKGDVRRFRETFAELRAPLVEAQELRTKELEEAAKEKLKLRREKLVQLKEKLAELQQSAASLELDALTSSFEEITRESEALDLSKLERQQLEKQLRSLKDLIAEKREHSLLNLSEDEKKRLENLQLVLEQKKQRRAQTKKQLDAYRKTLSGSGLDFEKAMHYRELIDQEKERLDKADRGIEEIEAEIDELE